MAFQSEQTTRDDGTVVLALDGELDLNASPELKDLLTEVAGSAPRLIVDLSRVRFMDSAGAGLLVGAMKRMNARGS